MSMRPPNTPLRPVVPLGIGLWALMAPTCGAAQTGPPPAPAQAADSEAVIERVMEAYGGVEAVRRIGSHRQEGMLVAVRGGLHGRLYRISTAPDRLSILVEYPSRAELRILEGDRAWRGPSATGLEPVQGPLRGAMVLQAARAWLPRLLDAHRSDVSVAGASDGRTVLDVRVADGLVLRVFVEDSTGLVVRSESILEAGPGSVGFATDYSDFREVDGLVFPFREETFASGFHTGSAVLELVEVNPKGDRARLPVPRGR